jgi:hypothetical protein
MQSEEMRRALAELKARQDDMLRVETARIHEEVSQALAEIDRAHLKAALDQVRAQLQSPEFKGAIERAAREAAQAARAETEADTEAARQRDDSRR